MMMPTIWNMESFMAMTSLTKSCELCKHWSNYSGPVTSGMCKRMTCRAVGAAVTAESGVVLVSNGPAHARTHKNFLCKKFEDR